MSIANVLSEKAVKKVNERILKDVQSGKSLEYIYTRIGSYTISALYGLNPNGILTKDRLSVYVQNGGVRKEIVHLLYAYYRFVYGVSRSRALALLNYNNPRLRDGIVLDSISSEPLRSKYDLIKKIFNEKEI